MEKIFSINSIKEYNDLLGVDTLHPLISVVHFDQLQPLENYKLKINLFAIFLKNAKCGDIYYGCEPYDYEDGTLVFIAPGQVYGIDSHGQKLKPSGYALVFHPDLLVGTNLGKEIQNYSFFSYEIREALHLSKKERNTIIDCLDKIVSEIDQNIDKHSKMLIVSNIELFLNYCVRFYDRQFITRTKVNNDILTRFEKVLTDYITENKGIKIGLPTVSYCADQLHLSTNYFGDLIKKETGSSATDYIQTKLIDAAKIAIGNNQKPINEIAYELGFKYPQHFTRLFKKKTGITPNDFRNLN